MTCPRRRYARMGIVSGARGRKRAGRIWPQAAALLSCAVFTEKGEDEEAALPPELAGPYQKLQVSARALRVAAQRPSLRRARA